MLSHASHAQSCLVDDVSDVIIIVVSLELLLEGALLDGVQRLGITPVILLRQRETCRVLVGVVSGVRTRECARKRVSVRGRVGG